MSQVPPAQNQAAESGEQLVSAPVSELVPELVPEPVSEPAADSASDPAYDYDVIVVGSGFGGSVTALRLTEKGYRVGVLEAGRRFTPRPCPRTPGTSRTICGPLRSACTGSSVCICSAR